MDFLKEIKRRRTFGIKSHPDAGKTTLTEKLLLFGGAIQEAGAVKSNKINNFALFVDILMKFVWTGFRLSPTPQIEVRVSFLWFG